MVHRASESAADLRVDETAADLQASFGEVKARMIAMHSTGSWLMSISDLAYFFLSFSFVSLLQNQRIYIYIYIYILYQVKWLCIWLVQVTGSTNIL